MSRRLESKRWRAVLVALAACIVVGALAPRPARAADAPLVVALDHVVPSHAPGSKYRTPATIDTALAEELARRLGRPLQATERGPADLRLTMLGSGEAPEAAAVISLPYRAAPMASMRTDSGIRRWEDLRGRTACVAAGGGHVGDVQDRHGAVEIVHPSLTEALVALRTGGCDVLVHDNVLLQELLRLPEWKKFSRRLTSRREGVLAFLVPRENAPVVARLREVASEWKAKSYTDSLVRTAVRDIAFEVYVEQEVPDCH